MVMSRDKHAGQNHFININNHLKEWNSLNIWEQPKKGKIPFVKKLREKWK